MKGKVVGVQRATIHDNFVTEVYGDAAEVKRYGTQHEAYLDMVAGRLDLLLADSVALKGRFLDTEQGKDYEFVGPDFSDPTYFRHGAGVELPQDDEEMREKLNEARDALTPNR